MTATYRFVGEAPEVFPDLSGGRIQVAGANHDPNAEDFQQPGELRPGQEFTGPDELVHVRIERRSGAGGWESTVAAESPAEDVADEPTAPPPVVPMVAVDAGDGTEA